MAYDHDGLETSARRIVENDPVRTLDELAQRLRVSRKTLGVAIREKTGLGAKAWFDRLWVGRVRAFLRAHPEETCEAAAEALGFTSIRVMQRLTRRAAGLTPRELRRLDSAQTDAAESGAGGAAD